MDTKQTLMQLLRSTERRLQAMEHAHALANMENLYLRGKLHRMLLERNALMGEAIESRPDGCDDRRYSQVH